MTSLIPINLPEGLFKNGTSYKAKGRWADASLVRWHDGALRPIGGWAKRTDTSGVALSALSSSPSTEVIRDAFSWRDNSQDVNSFYGSNTKAYHVDDTGTKTDITPAGIVTTSKDAVSFSGYGKGLYGSSLYGITYDMAGREATPVNRWFTAAWGELLLYGLRNSGNITEIDPSTLTPAVVTNAPTVCSDVIVTSNNRQVFAIGTNDEPRRVRTSDVEDRNQWTPAMDNQCIDRVLAGEGRLLRCVEILNTILILGEKDVHKAEYIRPPLVWSIRPVGANCTLLAPSAVVTTDEFAVWWGDRSFWVYDGTLRQLSCEVIDYLYENIDLEQVSKISAFANSQYSEIWWLYQSTNSDDIDSYVYWNYAKNHWNVGSINRTATLDKGVLPFVTMIGEDSIIYNHELEFSLPSIGDIYCTTGPLELGNGDQEMCVHQIFSDTDNEFEDGVTYTLLGKQLPDLSPITFGPYQRTNPVGTTGAAARSIQLRVDFLKSRTEHGIVRFDVSPGGGRG